MSCITDLRSHKSLFRQYSIGPIQHGKVHGISGGKDHKHWRALEAGYRIYESPNAKVLKSNFSEEPNAFYKQHLVMLLRESHIPLHIS